MKIGLKRLDTSEAHVNVDACGVPDYEEVTTLACAVSQKVEVICSGKLSELMKLTDVRAG